jgi:hypothetical protein
MSEVLYGVIHGKTIELEQDPGLEEGRRVTVILQAKKLPGPPPGWYPGCTKTAAGMLADSWTEEDDKILDELRHSRKIDREIPE